MKTQRIGIIMNGVTGRMGTNQHLIRSIKAIRDEGGVKVGNALILMPDPILTGRNHDKLKAPTPLRPRAFGGKGAEGMRKDIPSNQ